MKYLGYYQVIGQTGWKLSDDLEFLKNQWCFGLVIFEVNISQEDLDAIPYPRYDHIVSKFKVVYEYGINLYERKGHRPIKS